MTETKRRQGQKGVIPRPLCPKCGEYLKRSYTRGTVNGKRCFVESGWTCPEINCDYIVKDFVELEEELQEEAEKSTDKAEKIKKLTAQFLKTHEQLNKLAEQINDFERGSETHDGKDSNRSA
jgi:hypothetical protein